MAVRAPELFVFAGALGRRALQAVNSAPGRANGTPSVRAPCTGHHSRRRWQRSSSRDAQRGNSALQLQRLLDWPMRSVPIVEAGRFTRVVDKQSLAEQIARVFIRDQVARALSTQ